MESYAQQEERETWETIAHGERSSTERAGYRRLEAKYAGQCDACAGAVAKGETILYNRRHELRLLCLACGARADAGEELEHNGPPRPTRRERLEARAEKRAAWAESRESKARAAQERVHAIADGIPFGQPILVGHLSVGRLRRDVAKIEAGMSATVEHDRMSRHHAEKAAGLEEQLARSIYDDDPDAIERLEEKLERLEGERDRIKAYNAAVRKPGVGPAEAELLQRELLDDRQRADIRSIARACPYQLGKRGEFPGYALSNLGATIRTTRERLERLRRQKGM
jgi:hypothetical protein